jgi:hypothetical protein
VCEQDCKVRGSNSGRKNEFFCSLKGPDRLWGPLSLLFNWHPASFLEVKPLGRDTSLAPPSSAGVNKWSCKPAIPKAGGLEFSFTANVQQVSVQTELLRIAKLASST